MFESRAALTVQKKKPANKLSDKHCNLKMNMNMNEYASAGLWKLFETINCHVMHDFLVD